MTTDNYYFAPFMRRTALAGLIYSIIIIVAWYLFTGVELVTTVLIPCMLVLLWVFSAWLAWIFSNSYSYLATKTCLWCIGIIAVFAGILFLSSDNSMRGFTFLTGIGAAIFVLPMWVILYFLLPKIEDEEDE